ncbi:MAG: hypothetical protein OEX07_03360 [Gammaproteobacteria bacterium]|nr:hypothetical protein [Gammaproteobacteria bacterium]
MTTEKDVVRKVIRVCQSINHPQQIDGGVVYCDLALMAVVSDEAVQTIIAAQMMLLKMRQAAAA